MLQSRQDELATARDREVDVRPPLRRLSVRLIRAYQIVLSPLFMLINADGCRFYPTCSEYAIQAIGLYGVWRGTIMTVKRLARCHPFHRGGYDPPLPRS